MSKTTGRLLAALAVLVLAGCVREPFPPPYYAAPAPPPLQPYMGPPVYAPPPAPARKRYVKKRVKRAAPKVDCRCVPVQ